MDKSVAVLILHNDIPPQAGWSEPGSNRVRLFWDQRVSTPTSPPTRAPCDPSDVTTCVPSNAYVLGVTKRPSEACSAST